MITHDDSTTAGDSLVLDIGGQIGALVIYTGADRVETEIELSPGAPDVTARRSHNVVHARRNRHGVQYSAVFPHLDAGRYTVWQDATTPHGTANIHGGQVTDYELA